ncbi:hypothetical protein [Synechococcus sp. M16CYN]|uniref:hypothetical protein n=1 Tax=Synechococcus sp. M16CYN TaxID=3103139 RepID=UPI003342BA35
MARFSRLSWFVAVAVSLSGCSQSTPQSNGNRGFKAMLERLELRVNQLEHQLNDIGRSAIPPDSKTPTGPLRSLTLRMGTKDDRLRLYWGDGQTSNLTCSQEGNGIWACG